MEPQLKEMTDALYCEWDERCLMIFDREDFFFSLSLSLSLYSPSCGWKDLQVAE